MERVLEPELMEDPAQVIAYAQADFEAPHNDFIERLKAFVDDPKFSGTALDLGCGPGDITFRFAKAFPGCKVDAIDGSKPMLEYALSAMNPELSQRVNFIHGRLPKAVLPQLQYDLIYSNSLLHHLHEAQNFWQVIKQYSYRGTIVMVMDLFRPKNVDAAAHLVTQYAANEPPVLRQDFFNSLLAAFSFEEIESQLKQANLPLSVQAISDRHVLITGRM